MQKESFPSPLSPLVALYMSTLLLLLLLPFFLLLPSSSTSQVVAKASDASGVGLLMAKWYPKSGKTKTGKKCACSCVRSGQTPLVDDAVRRPVPPFVSSLFAVMTGTRSFRQLDCYAQASCTLCLPSSSYSPSSPSFEFHVLCNHESPFSFHHYFPRLPL